MSASYELARYRPESPTLLTLGVFDGVHRGHLYLIDTLRAHARTRGLLPGIVTFTPHPMEVLHPCLRLPLLTSLEERLQLLKEKAETALIAPLTFTRELSEYSPDEFVQVLLEHLNMAGLVLGPDFGMGKDRAGTVRTLERLGSDRGFSVEVVPPYRIGGEIVSSTAIREALSQGDLKKAACMLGRRFSVSGTVISTSRRGASLGYPTANLIIGPERALPRDGVYATIAHVPNGRFGAVTNIGYRPTFGLTERVVETHILDFDGHIYGTLLKIEFLAMIRGEITFRNPEALVAQIHLDVKAARQVLGEYG